MVDIENYVKKINCQKFLSLDDDILGMKYIDKLIEDKKFYPMIPGYFTNINLFVEDPSFWKKYYESMIYSVKCYLNKDVKIVKSSSWAHVTDESINLIKHNFWHNHIFKKDNAIDFDFSNQPLPNQNVICCIYYLNANPNNKNSGTEFSINDSIIFTKPEKNSWFLFPPELNHTTGKTYNKRYVLAANVI